jgi:LAS superfamily LD-carboxypeptidase LdcB
MAIQRSPGPTCQVANWFLDPVDTGTAARTRNQPPGPAGTFGEPAGRIPLDERLDPGQAMLENVDRYGEPHLSKEQGEIHQLTRRAAESLRALRAAAKAAGTWVAQDRSEHITGRTFDLRLGLKNSSENAKARAFDNLPQYKWLKANAHQFGLNPYPYLDAKHAGEPWHWSFNAKPAAAPAPAMRCRVGDWY